MSNDVREQAPAPERLGRLVGRGAAWAVASNLVMRLASIAVTALLARLLSPAEFGTFAIALAVFLVVGSLAELGMGSAVARSAEEPTDIAPTVVTISIATSAALAVLMFLGADLLATWLGEPAAAQPLRVLSVSLVLTGVFAVPGAQLVREFRQDRVFLATVVGFLVSNPILVVLALEGGGATAFAWSRVIGQLAGGLVMVWSTSHRYRPGWRGPAVRGLLGFGLPLSLANLVNWSLLNADYMIIGRLADAALVGVYMIAFNVANWSTALMGSVLNTVVVPAFGRVGVDREQLGRALVSATRLVALVALPIAALSLVLADPLVAVLFGARWSDAAPVLAVLAVYGALYSFSLLFANVLVATGATRQLLAIQLAWVLVLVPGIVVGFRTAGLVGAAWGHVVTIALVAVPGYVWAALRTTGQDLRPVLGCLTRPALAAGAAGLAAWPATLVLEPAALVVVVGGLAGTVAYLAVAAPLLARHAPASVRRRFRPAPTSGAAPRRERRVKVLVVTHEATLSGAPRVALLVTRLLAGAGHDVRVLSRLPGPMLAHFAAEAPTTLEPVHRWRGRLWRRAPRPLALAVDALLATVTLARSRPDLVYVNSTSAALYARAARWTRRPAIVLHGHESGANSAVFLRRAGLRRAGEGISLVACSPSVHRELADLLDLPGSSIAMLPSVPDDRDVLARAQVTPEPAYDDRALVVGCCGTAELRKGVDLWETAATKVREALPDADLRFVWVGAADDARSGTVEFLGPVENPYPHLRRFDLLVLPSRDDPFPLVVLEAMLLGTPVVAFDVGAVREQVGDAGVMVPAEDTTALADAVVRLVTDDEGRRRLGEAARVRASTRFSTDAFARGLEDVVAGVTRAGRPIP